MSITLFNDGVREPEEGFIVLIGVDGDNLVKGDAGYIDVVKQAFAVVLRDGGT